MTYALRFGVAGLALISSLALAQTAEAHVSIASGPGFADATQEIVFGVGHGCEGADTLSIRVAIPASVTSVRPVSGGLGLPKVEKSAAGLVTAVTWTKPLPDVVEGDPNYYKVALRLKVPNQPFTTLAFPTTQTCRTPAGVMSTTEWIADPNTAPAPTPDAGVADAGVPETEPAPLLLIVPPRLPGWNKYTVPAAIANPATFFADAQIVWSGAAAFSANPNIAAVIKTEPNTQELTAIAAGATVWVKY